MARKYQQGSLFKRGKSRKVWVGRWWEDVVTPEGTTIRVRRSEVIGFVADLPRVRDAEEVFQHRLRQINRANYNRSAVRFDDFVRNEWEKVVLPTLKYATQRFYAYVLKAHLIPAFGELPLREITRERIQTFLNQKLASGLSWETVHHLQCGLSKVLSAAVEWDYLEHNPVRRTKLPRRRRNYQKAVLAPQDVRVLLLALLEPSRSLAFLLIVTGLRIGELLALRWRNVDLRNGVVRIEETVYDGHFDDPKSRSSVRSVPLGPRGRALLTMRLAQCGGTGESLVFHTASGKPLDRRLLLARQLKPAAEAAGIGKIGWHLLRHANATLHDSVGTPLGTVQALLGHSSSEITRQVYLHSLPQDRREAVDKLEAVLFGPKSDPFPQAEQRALPMGTTQVAQDQQEVWSGRQDLNL